MKDQRKTKVQLIKELEALRQSEERYRQFFESAHDAIMSLTLDGIITAVNRGAEVLLGWSREEQIGQHYREFLTPSSFIFTEERARRIQAGEKVSSIYEAGVMRKDGSVVLVEARSRFIRGREGRSIGILVIYRDITERKRTEEALRDSEERYRSLFENANDAIISISLDGTITAVNRGLEVMTGWSREELIGQPYYKITTPRGVDLERERNRRALAGEKPPSVYEAELMRKDGSIVPFEGKSRFMRDREGKPVGHQTILRDITERKQAEEEREKLQEQLFQARKLEALGTLAGGVAHDFNNILSAIMGFTELATDEVPESTLVRRNLEEILKASRRAKALVQQILIFSRPNQQKHEPIQPQPTIAEVLTFLRASLPPTIEIRYHIDETAGSVAISSSQLQQVLTNLCTNAIQALGEKGGVLEIRVQRTEVVEDLTHMQKNLRPGPHLKLTVSDTGCGMTPEVLERIFEPFFTSRSVGEGNGLGLAIVHGIVTGHGGAITVESTPGKGTTFQVYLPVSDNDVAAENAFHRPTPPADVDSGDEKGALSDAMHFGH